MVHQSQIGDRIAICTLLASASFWLSWCDLLLKNSSARPVRCHQINKTCSLLTFFCFDKRSINAEQTLLCKQCGMNAREIQEQHHLNNVAKLYFF